MKDALHFSESMLIRETKRIWLQGTQGFDRLKQNTMFAMHNKNFYDFQQHTYYYMSFVKALPEILMELKLPYHEEYFLARGVKNGKN